MRNILLPILLAGCSGSDAPADPSDAGPDAGPADATIVANPLEGDWFGCNFGGCTSLDDDGFRFFPDGTFIDLTSGGTQLGSTSLYCEWAPQVAQSYVLDGDMLTLTRGAASEVISYAAIARVEPTRSRGPCPATTPRDPFLETFEAVPPTVPTGERTTIRWNVPNAQFVQIRTDDDFGGWLVGATGEMQSEPLHLPTRFLLYANGNFEELNTFLEVGVTYDVETFLEAGESVVGLDFAEDHIVWTNRGTYTSTYADGRVSRANLDGSGATIIASDQPLATWVLSEGGWVYWMAALEYTPGVDPIGAIRRAPILGGGVETLVEATDIDAPAFDVDGTSVYFSRATPPSREVARAPLDVSAPPELLATGLHYVDSAIDVHADHLYYRHTLAFDTHFLALALDGSVATATIATHPKPGDIVSAGPVVTDAYVFWASSFNSPTGRAQGEIYRAPRSGGAPELLAGPIDGAVYRLVADDELLLFIANSGESLGAIRLATGELQVLVSMPLNVLIGDAALTNTHVYYTVTDPITFTGRIERTARP